MNLLRKKITPLSILLAFLMINMTIPYQPALAAIIGTDTYVETSQIEKAKEQVLKFFAREEVRKAFIDQGVDPREAESRIASLSDAEILKLSEMIGDLPAGGDVLGFTIGILLIVLLVILILRLA